MALLRKLFYRKPPDGLLEICERVYVFDCCFTTDAWEERNYKGYVGNVISQLREHFPDASILVFNFREGETQSQIASALSDYDMTIMDYPRHYEGCPLLPMEVIHHFLRSSESWLSLGLQNVLLMHCERGGWPVLAFMLAALLIYRRQYSGEQKTLDMVYKQAPRELLHCLSPLNPVPSQLRYLQYVSRRNLASAWPPLDRELTLDCVIIRMIPDFDGEGGCRPIVRIYGQDPFLVGNRTPKLLFPLPTKSKHTRYYKQAECELVKIDINCHIQGDIVLECISLHEDMEREEMMFRVMFNTAFIRSNILMLNRDEIDTLWDAKDQFPKDFRAEVLFSETDSVSSIIPVDLSCFEEKDGLPVEAFARVQEIFSSVDWWVPKGDAALEALQQTSPSNASSEKSENDFHTGRLQSVRPAALGNDPESPTRLTPKKTSGSPKLSPTAVAGLKQAAETLYLSLSKLSDTHVLESSPKLPSPPRTETKSPKTVPPAPLAPILHPKEEVTGPHTPPFPSETPLPPVTPPLKDKIEVKNRSPPSSSISLRTPAASSLPLKDRIECEPLKDFVESTGDKLPPPRPSPPPSLPTASLSTPAPSVVIDDVEARCFPSPLPSAASVAKATGVGIPPPPAPPLPSLSAVSSTVGVAKDDNIERPPPPPPPPPPAPPLKGNATICEVPPAPPPPTPPLTERSVIRASAHAPPPPPPVVPPKEGSCISGGPPSPPPPPTPPLKQGAAPTVSSTPPPPHPPTPPLKQGAAPTASSAPPPPPPPAPGRSSQGSSVPTAPPPPIPLSKEGASPSHLNVTSSNRGSNFSGASPPPPSAPPPGTKGKSVLSRTITSKSNQSKKLKPLHWLKLTRAVQGSLWAETQKSGEAAKAPEIDIQELESLFSAAVPNSEQGGSGRKTNSRASVKNKPEKIQLIDHRRAYNCEIMLSKVKIPLPDLMSSVLALEETALDVDQVDNLIKFCPTKEEMELLKGYKGDKDKLGKCEQFFLELMQVPRIESKLRVFSFKIQFRTQVSDLRKSLNVVNSAADEIRGSAKLKRIMQTILSLGNALNQGTARGSAIGFRLDSLLKLTETRARNNKMTLMHYLCKVLADKLPELLDFWKDLSNLEPASKIQLKFLAEEMQAINKGLEKVVQELSMSENDGPVSEYFLKALKEFLSYAEGEVRSLASLYSGVGRNVDALILYFGEDPARCPFEQVVSTLLNFVRMFKKAHEENCKQLEFERKKAEKEAAMEKMKTDTSKKDPKEASTEKAKIKASEEDTKETATENMKINASEKYTKEAAKGKTKIYASEKDFKEVARTPDTLNRPK